MFDIKDKLKEQIAQEKLLKGSNNVERTSEQKERDGAQMMMTLREQPRQFTGQC